jgi:hypothetical protein
MEMPFGKHKGEDLEDIPSDYLKWLIFNCEDELVQEEAEKEYNWRSDWNKHFFD